MRRKPIDSTAIASVGYDEKSEVLEIQYTNGNTYQYLDVPLAVVEELMTAPSRGAYVNLHIKDHYRYRRI